MAQPLPRSARYVISARRDGSHVEQKRITSASAIVLALAWLEAGYTEVTIVDPCGQTITPDDYRDDAKRGRLVELERALRRGS